MTNAGNVITLIQVTRIGDILQTYQAVKQITKQNPELKFNLIARRQMVAGIRSIISDQFENIYEFEAKDFFYSENDVVDLKTVNGNLSDFIKRISASPIDVLINLSFNKTSEYLATIIPAKSKLGPRRNKNAQIEVYDRWGQFVFSNVMTGDHNPFSLVDIFKNMICDNNSSPIYKTDHNERQKKIIIHPFASLTKKRWGHNKWTELTYQLLKNFDDHIVQVVGSKHDCADANLFLSSPILKKYLNRLEISVGEKSISEVFEDLSTSALFIGHDSMVSHLASLTNTKSIVISLGTVRPQETTPYNNNIINVAPKIGCFPCTVAYDCEILPCHSKLSYQPIVAISNLLLNNTEVTESELAENIPSFHLNNLFIYKSRIDEDHGLILDELTENYQTVESTFKLFYRVLWSFYFKNKEFPNTLPLISEDTAYQLRNYLSGVNNLFELYNFGINFANGIITEAESDNPDINEIQHLSAKLEEIDQLTILNKTHFPHLAPFIDYFVVAKSNVEGKNIIEMANNTLVLLHNASNLTAVLFEFVEQAISAIITESNKSSEV